jgi:hypothetical protein
MRCLPLFDPIELLERLAALAPPSRAEMLDPGADLPVYETGA